MNDAAPGLTIEGRLISADAPPYVVAEISANHNGRLESALELIEQAKNCGASAVKIQTYTADTITIDCDLPAFRITGGLWRGRSLFELYQEAHTPWEWHPALFAHARKVGITIFSSPFDQTAIELLERLGTPAYKIASFELVDLGLIECAASTGKPLIMSTGMASRDEIGEALEAARSAGCSQLALLHCVSAYPAPSSDYNLRTLVDMASSFGAAVGLSDHTLGNETAIAAVALGACLVEKHFTLDRAGGGPDDSFSLTPAELGGLCEALHSAWAAMGTVAYGPSASEVESMKFRRSLFVVSDVAAGERVSARNVRSIRPSGGLSCRLLPKVMGMTFNQHVPRGTPLRADHLDLKLDGTADANPSG